jgi:hypothetical protein
MRFAYYRRLTRRQQAVYRASDAQPALELAAPELARRAAAELRSVLARGTGDAAHRQAVERAAGRLARELCRQLAVEPVAVRVLARRPHSDEAELHGLYIWEPGRRARIQLWLRTARRRQVVAFRTFLRTLLHELCHHLDFHRFELEESFHTEGFFRRESQLARMLLAERAEGDGPAAAGPRRERPAQLALPLAGRRGQ